MQCHFIVLLDPACKAGLAGYLPVYEKLIPEESGDKWGKLCIFKAEIMYFIFSQLLLISS